MTSILYIAGMGLVNQLRQFRFAAGEMTQQQLADRAGVTRQTVISIEKGVYRPSVELALRLAAALGTTVEELFQIDESKEEVRR